MTLWLYLLISTLLIRFDLVYSEEEEEILTLKIDYNRKPRNVTKFIEHAVANIEESLSTVRVAQDYSCAEYDALKDTYWALKWADNFKEAKANLSDWEIPSCDTGKGLSHGSACVWENVQLRSGLLLLLAKEVSSSPKPRRFTSGLAFTRTHFAFDRLQLRLALPLGSHLSTSILAFDSVPYKEALKTEPAQVHTLLQSRLLQGRPLLQYFTADADYLEILNYTQNEQPLTHVLALNETTHLKDAHEGAEATPGELAHFHTHGVQWTEDGLEFSLDDGAISRIAHRRLRRAAQKLMFSIGVGGPVFSDPIPEVGEPLDWICPALIVDSVRVFDRVSEEFAKGLARCTFHKQTDDSVIEQICPKLKSFPNWGKTAGNDGIGLAVLLVVTLGCILSVVIYLLIKFAFLGNSQP